MTHRNKLLLLAALLPLAATAQDKCTVQGQVEQDRVVREYSGQRPAKGDREAELTWSRNMNSALAAAAKRAEECTRSSKPATPAAAAMKQEDCIAGAVRGVTDLEKRYQGRTLTSQEQATKRSEEQRLIEQRMSCTNRISR